MDTDGYHAVCTSVVSTFVARHTCSTLDTEAWCLRRLLRRLLRRIRRRLRHPFL